MSMLDELIAQTGGNLDLGAIGAKFGLTPDQVHAAAGQLLPQIADPNVDNGEATAQVAANTGIDVSALSGLVPALVAAASGGNVGNQGGILGSLVAGLGGAAERQPGILGTISGMLDRDGDGNPINDVIGMFGKK